MSGALSQYRTPSKPMVVGGQTVVKLDSEGRPVMKHKLIPGPVSKDGRPTGYQVLEYPATLHVLDYASEYHRPSKHARGRIRPRTPEEQRRARALQARFERASRKVTLLQQQTVELAAL